MYRLHIDVPVGNSREEATEKALAIIGKLLNIDELSESGQVKLSDDTDRASRNYLEINGQGHAGTKKTPLASWNKV